MKLSILQKWYIKTFIFLFPLTYILVWLQVLLVREIQSFSIYARMLKTLLYTFIPFSLSFIFASYFINFRFKQNSTYFRIFLLFSFIVFNFIFFIFMMFHLSFIKYYPASCAISAIGLHGYLIREKGKSNG